MSVESSTTLESVQETPSERVGSLGLPLLSGEEALCAGAEKTLKNKHTQNNALTLWFPKRVHIYISVCRNIQVS